MNERAPALNQISTRWGLIQDPEQFALRYAPAIRKYLEALLRDPDDAAEATQEFLLKGLRLGLVEPAELRGRFRDYLKRAVRNTGLNCLRRKRPATSTDMPFDQLADRRGSPDPADMEWLAGWRQCVLDRGWHRLDAHQRQAPDSLCHTVLRLTVDHPKTDSATLATLAGKQAGRSIRPDAFRKQLSRARRLFAEFLVAEVAQTLERASPDEVEAELADVGLLATVRDFLPPDWKTRLGGD